ncbi:MAG TPA: sigma-70 family RNA polymerase sigma factor [Rickettsiales bacterium]|nr:sigma-70 family RNA polymerase sigma factor [Rickettsiales bacterium]
MNPKADVKRFNELFAPHMNASYNLARWLTGSESAAQDVVQESYLRAFRFMHRFTDGNARAWLLAIVRNQSYTWLKQSGVYREVSIGDEIAEDDHILGHMQTPELAAIRNQDAALLHKALAALALPFREVIILKELEEMAYKDISAVIEIPIGTVMSRLARARKMLKTELLKLYSHD